MAVLTRYRCSCWLLVIAVAACGRQNSASLASRGEVDDHAPVRATASIIIDAAPADVWRVLADIGRWPEWQHDIQTTTISGLPAVDVPFQWSTSGETIHSRIMVFEPARRIAWAGNLLIFHAVHIWVLHARPDGETAVETDESMTGWPINWLYSSKDLLVADQRWLAALKKKMEDGGSIRQ